MSVVSTHGMKIEALENMSMIVSIVSYSSDWGSLTMKSRAMEVKGNVYLSDVMGKRGGLGFVGLFFLDWQVAHPLM